jgi:8-oxo-dGTP pyrophosphatase MutT (NUDIX family)
MTTLAHGIRPAKDPSKPERYTGLIIPGRSGSYLALYHLKGQEWRFAGGKIEEGELPMSCAAREAYEEFGIVVTAMRFQQIVTHEADGQLWEGHWFVVDAFDGVPDLKEPHKHSGFRWLTLVELATLNAHPEHEVAAAHYAGHLKHVMELL